MQTIDIHTHLLAPGVRFDRPFDRFAMLEYFPEGHPLYTNHRKVLKHAA